MDQIKNKQLYKNKTKLNKLSKNQTNTPKYQNLKKVFEPYQITACVLIVLINWG